MSAIMESVVFVEGNVCDESLQKEMCVSLQKEMGAFGSKEEFGACGVSPQFNASIVITELLSKTLENCARELASRCIRECALRHGFDGELEIRLLGLENVSLIKKQMAKKSGPKAVKVSKDVSRVKKSTFPLPFLPANVDLTKCHGLAYNRGLFTQCSKEQMSTSAYCKGCQSECDSSASGIPCCGTVEQRLSSGLYEFKDPKGRSPIRYTKVLEKAKLSAEQAEEEAGKLSINIPEEHFALAEKAAKVAGAKGRPKKATGAIDAADVADLFSKLTAPCEEKEAEAEAEEKEAEAEAEEKEAEEKEEKEEPVKKKSKLSEEEKAAKKEALELERATKKAERESKLAQDKEVREANRKAEAEKKKAEREAKVAEEKAEREAKVAEEKAEREAKRLKEKEEKEAKKAAEKEAKNAKKPAATATATVAAPVVTKVTVTPIEIDGKKYLITKNNVLYIAETKEEIGTYDQKTKTIKLLPDEEEEEEEQEEEYEEIDN
jgi:hypothetical protein